jgi:hypothetical protein
MKLVSINDDRDEKYVDSVEIREMTEGTHESRECMLTYDSETLPYP